MLYGSADKRRDARPSGFSRARELLSSLQHQRRHPHRFLLFSCPTNNFISFYSTKNSINELYFLRYGSTTVNYGKAVVNQP